MSVWFMESFFMRTYLMQVFHCDIMKGIYFHLFRNGEILLACNHVCVSTRERRGSWRTEFFLKQVFNRKTGLVRFCGRSGGLVLFSFQREWMGHWGSHGRRGRKRATQIERRKNKKSGERRRKHNKGGTNKDIKKMILWITMKCFIPPYPKLVE